MRRCDYCGHVAEYDGQPHGIEDCAEHLRQHRDGLLATVKIALQIECQRAHIGEEDPELIAALEQAIKGDNHE